MIKNTENLIKEFRKDFGAVISTDDSVQILEAVEKWLEQKISSKPVEPKTSIEDNIDWEKVEEFFSFNYREGRISTATEILKYFKHVFGTIKPKTRVTEDDYVIHGNDWDGYGIKYGNEVIVYVGHVADPDLAKIMIEKANQYISLSQESAEREDKTCIQCGIVPAKGGGCINRADCNYKNQFTQTKGEK